MLKRSCFFLSLLATLRAADTEPLMRPSNGEQLHVPWFGSRSYLSYVFNQQPSRVELQAPVKLNDYVADGKIELSLRSYLELVIANNTDIILQKLTLEQPKNNITRAFSQFDPVGTARLQWLRTNTPTTDVLAGASTVSQLGVPFTFNYQQLMPSSTTLSAGFTSNKNSSNNQFQQFNPAYNAGLNLTLTQPLLRNFGPGITRVPILIARTRVKGAEFNLEDNVLRLVAGAENAYWDVVGARENLRVQEQSLALADASLKRAQRELDLGALSALEIYQPQANYARAEIFVTQARYRLAQTEDALRRQMGVDLDPDVRKLPVTLTESVLPPNDTTAFDKESIVTTALRNRPDLKSVQNSINVDDFNIRLAGNNLKPDFAFGGIYQAQGRGGPFTPRNITGGGSAAPIPGGYFDALDQLFGFGFPGYGGFIQLRLPIRDRRAAADLADALVSKKINSYNARRSEQNIRLEVLNAINQVENSRASVDLAKIAADLAQKRVEADQKRYDLGTITLFFLLDSQTALTQAQSDLVNNSVTYRRNQLQLLQRTGTLLQDRGIVIQ